MKIIISSLTIILLLSIVLKIISINEGYQNQQLDPSIIKGYNNFLSFYNQFCESWQKAIISSIASDTPQQPLTSPSQVSSATPQTPTESEMNIYIQQLSETLQKPLPPICTTLPAQIDSSSLPNIIKEIPTDPQPYMNALTWMNTQLQQSHSNLNVALQGNPVEGFDNICQDLSQCIQNNPQLAQQIAEELAQQQKQSLKQEEKTLSGLINPFIENQALVQSLSENQDLVKKSQDIQNQAQSGQLLSNINTPESDSQTTYNIPEGGNTLSQMKNENPEQYNKLKQNYGMWFQIKSLMEQINSNLG